MSKITWHRYHHIAGLKLSILMAFILITGTLATISHEIDWLVDSDRRIEKAFDASEVNWGAAYSSAQKAKPDWLIESLNTPLNEQSAIEVIVLTNEGERRRLFVNPHTSAIQGEAAWLNTQRFLRDTHRRLFIMNDWGIILVSSLSILLIASLITGLMTYKKFWRGFLKRPRTNDRRTLWGDIHRLAAVWSLWFIMIISATGLWYLIEAGLEKWGDDPSKYVKTTYTVTDNKQKSGLNDYIDQVKSLDPEFEIKTIKLPIALDDTLEIQGQSDAILTRPRANLYAFDMQSGQLVHTINGKELTALGRIVEMADFLHFGTWGSLSGKILYFIFGIFLSGIALSGVYIYSKRIRNASGTSKHPILQTMGPFKYVAFLILSYWAIQIPSFAENIGNGRQLKGDIHGINFAGCKGQVGIINTSNHIEVTLNLDPKCASNFTWPVAGIKGASMKKFKLGSKGLKIKIPMNGKHESGPVISVLDNVGNLYEITLP